MGGRGSYASGCKKHEYETIGTIHGVKVIKNKDNRKRPGLPAESYSSNSYILLDKNNIVLQYKGYDNQHKMLFDIDYSPEPHLSKNGEPIFHKHIYDSKYKNGRSPAMRMTESEIKEYSKYFDIKNLKKRNK